MQLLGLAQPFFAELSRKEKYFSVDLAQGSTVQFFLLHLPIGSREKQILHAQRSCPGELTGSPEALGEPSAHAFLLLCFFQQLR